LNIEQSKSGEYAELISRIYVEQWGSIVAILIRLLSKAGVTSFALAEEAAQEAFALALAQWPIQGPPASPRAWLVATARHKAIDTLRRQTRWSSLEENRESLDSFDQSDNWVQDSPPIEPVEDDRLRLIFTCCHPALSTEAQVALTLRTLCGITTEQIASAFLIPVPTMAQRLVRARNKIRDAGIPYRVPSMEELPERLTAVLLVVYLVFNQGYNLAAAGNQLCAEAIRLGRLIVELLPDESEGHGLLAFMLLTDARRAARISASGDLILLEDQDRSLWNSEETSEGWQLTEIALRGTPGPYSVQAAIAALHMRAPRASDTDWPQIVALYDVLLRMNPSPVIELNRAVAVAMAQDYAAGLRLLNELEQRGELSTYSMLSAAQAALLLRTGLRASAVQAYRRAISLATNDVEKRFLMGRLQRAESTTELGTP
jgi:RNA polymerase sigma-70 factor (ECF subfamily)